ncbi:peroxisomal sarcosine oxidase [Trichonephila inaurata madagascariensis]|uniref:Peroxisomal sarcosine oxidase n=1 Tax=Trichonephila inaurata madagascariensis TaxID=2747483 RepID=A0A8X6K1K9_9ARAC|nr:peroxisomal sarcosine oxidase [Trichonephila inaurata madagascariensis]
MAEFDFDHAVVGGGIVGSWTALQLIRAGKKVLLLEQFSQPHSRGSSHGETRIIRSGYPEPFFCEMMPHAVRMWSEVEIETGKKLMETTGILVIAKASSEAKLYQNVVTNMKKFCPESLDTTDPRIDTLFSRLLHYDKMHGVLMDNSGGILRAHKAVLAIQALFRERGGEQWDNCRVQKLEPVGEEAVKLHLDPQKVITVKSVVVCAGCWAQKLLSPFVNLPLQAAVVRVYYFKSKEKGVYSEKSGFPCLIDLGNPDVYALPSYEYPDLVKICIHGGVNCDHEARDKTPQDPKIEKKLKDYVRDHFPLLEPEPSIVEVCMYTLTPDEVFLIDSVPKHKNIVYGAGFSGTGFKTSPVVGKLLSQLAMGIEPFLDISPYSPSRFLQKK